MAIKNKSIILFYLTFSVQVNAQDWNEVFKTVTSDRNVMNQFGGSVFISDNYVFFFKQY